MAHTPPRGVVSLSDPSAVRALAHPARLTVIDALYAGEVLTATACAARAGITPSAMSYHLRALEKHGIVQRAAAGTDGRERPWMRVGDVLRVDLHEDMRAGAASSIAAAGLLISSSMSLDQSKLVEAMTAEGSEGAWRGTTAYSREQLVLDPDQARELVAAVEALIAPYLADNRHGPRPEGSAVFAASFLLARDLHA